MSKTKAASRLLSSLLAILMVFCLFPKEAVSAENEEFEISVTTSYRMNINNDNGPVEAYIESQLLEKDPPITPIPKTVQPGDALVISLPKETEYLDKENEVRCFFTDTANNRVFENIYVIMSCYDENGEWIYPLPFKSSEHFVLNVDDPTKTVEFQLPTAKELADAGCVSATVTVYYEWGGHVYGIEPDNSGYVTDWVESVTRTVRQDDVALQAEVTDGQTVYNISDKENLSVEYSATMNLQNMSVETEDGSSGGYRNILWTVLTTCRNVIYDNTYVDIRFQFDEKLDLAEAVQSGMLKNLKLESDMFVLDDTPYTVNGNELVVHCHWDGVKARSISSLNPVIKISGICLPITESWAGNPVSFYSEGYIEGTAYYSLRKDPNYGVNPWGSNDGFHDDLMPLDKWLKDYYEFGYKDGKSFYQWLSDTKRAFTLITTEIKGGGGEDSDTFLLRLPDEPEAPEEPGKAEEEKPVISSAPYLKINQHWEDESDANRPDSVLVDVYHEEEYYTTVEVFAKYGWMGGTTIPERWKDDDWWVVEKDVPLGYDSDVEETHQLVFNITNTSENH